MPYDQYSFNHILVLFLTLDNRYNIPGIIIYMHEIFVCGTIVHTYQLKLVLEKARSSNIKLNKSKHCFKVQEMLMKRGIKPEQTKLKAIVIGQKEIQKIMGMVNYGPKFISSQVAYIKIGGHFQKCIWYWTSIHDKHLNNIKNNLNTTLIMDWVEGNFNPGNHWLMVVYYICIICFNPH